jgi:hypothetical protein
MIDCGQCACHGQSSTYSQCSIEGGCGHLHREDPSQRCRRGLRCADARSRTVHDEDGEPRRERFPAWAVVPNGLCRICTQLTKRAIEQLPADYVELGEMLGKTYGSTDEPTGGTRELPVPIRLGIEALQAAILDETDRWASALVESIDWFYYGTGQRRERVGYACGWLSGLFDRFLGLPACQQVRLDPSEECLSGVDSTVYAMESGLDGALLLLEMHEQVTTIAGRTARATRLWTPCPKCQRLSLEHPEGANSVDCKRCGHRMPYDRYEEMAGILAKAHEGTERPKHHRPHIPAVPDEPMVWVDGTEHLRVDTGSNMMLGYVQRHSDKGESAA